MNIDNNETKPQVKWVEIDENNEGQRLDNFLITYLKGVPKSRIYRLVRKGEVRVNKGRKNIKYRLVIGDVIRVAPIRVSETDDNVFIKSALKNSLENDIIFEDDVLIALNKPSGFAVHGGTGIDSGVIEALRTLRPDARFLELVHRLDKETSGCLLVAKKRSALRALHELFRGDGVDKTYLALLAGCWQRKKQWVDAPLLKNVAKGGERMVMVSKAGKQAETFFRRIQKFENATLVEASPKTGRTHQIRVHAAYLGHPIIADDRYGDVKVNHEFKKRGYKRLFLHAKQLSFAHPVTGEKMTVHAPLPSALTELLNNEKPL
ncbi:MAG: 23S rRNA pseudouridine(955/2504/2580) synthase RluC [Methylococcaceae bacterium]|nr:23S rRNA pseudouridine(955/2504/2580) synthase RluC [Methylococcaceae bacterium]